MSEVRIPERREDRFLVPRIVLALCAIAAIVVGVISYDWRAAATNVVENYRHLGQMPMSCPKERQLNRDCPASP